MARKTVPRLPRNPVVPKAHRSGAGAHRSPLDYRRSGARADIDEQLGEAPLIIYHLVPEPYYRGIAPEEPYVSERYYDEGFIHFTAPVAELAAAGNRYYRSDPRPYLMLEVDELMLTAPVRYEDPGRIFPHLYGPLNRDAITTVRHFRRAADGTFIGPGEPAET